jgi:superfamily II DNA or RNA helicase
MSKKEKLLRRFLSRPKDFTYDELLTLLSWLGYRELNKGKTSGSRVSYVNEDNQIISLHKPHPNPNLKDYQIKAITEALKAHRRLP